MEVKDTAATPCTLVFELKGVVRRAEDETGHCPSQHSVALMVMSTSHKERLSLH